MELVRQRREDHNKFLTIDKFFFLLNLLNNLQRYKVMLFLDKLCWDKQKQKVTSFIANRGQNLVSFSIIGEI